MLFEEQRELHRIEQGEVFLLNGAFNVDKETVGEVIAIRQKDGNVRTSVVYYTNNAFNVRLVQVFSPADFEKFIYQLNQKLAPNGDALVEFNYRTRTIDNPHTAILMEEEQSLLTGFFLKCIIAGHNRSDLYVAVNQKARELSAQMH